MMTNQLRLRDFEKLYENETHAEREARYKANRERTLKMLEEWEEFRKVHPEIAESMVC
jgi:hypothetical protein